MNDAASQPVKIPVFWIGLAIVAMIAIAYSVEG